MFDEKTKEKIEKAITESLPAQVGETLRKELERIPKLEAEVKRLTNDYSLTSHEVVRLQQENQKLREEISKHSLLDQREKVISEKERNLKIEELAYQLQAEKDKTDFTKQVALGLVRNTEYRRTLMDSVNDPWRDQYGNIMYSNKTQNSEETTSAQ
jgi:hypothetical protein